MKNTFFLSMLMLLVAVQGIDAQKLIFHKTFDSIEVKAFKDDDDWSVYVISVSPKGKIDTLWDNDHGTAYVYRIVDIKLRGNKFAIIYYGSDIVVYMAGNLKNGPLSKKGMSKILGMDYENFSCTAELLNVDKVRVRQKGVTQVITYDVDKGIELSRTTEKE